MLSSAVESLDDVRLLDDGLLNTEHCVHSFKICGEANAHLSGEESIAKCVCIGEKFKNTFFLYKFFIQIFFTKSSTLYKNEIFYKKIYSQH